ncbi:hypothetical protein [Aquimarina pacifica]|uniref:hypothetical protein n=1 Tax=Aquimarina pacifica TaxID=1296415 RepID=UPI000471D45B|nr:hypothetical protein [Aquimarina pacifica]
MSKISPILIIKGSLLFIIYGFLAINFVFRTPQTVPKFEELEVFEVDKGDISCVESAKKNPNYTKIIGVLDSKEIKTYDLGTKKCLSVLGINSKYISNKNQSEKYKIYVEHDEVRIFGEGWLLYQIEANGEILLSYEETSIAYLKSRKKFFYISLIVLVLLMFPVFRMIYKKVKK